MKPGFVFAAWPYVALAVLCLGIAFRFLRERNRIASVKAKLPNFWVVFGGMRWRGVAAGLLFLGHAAAPQLEDLD